MQTTTVAGTSVARVFGKVREAEHAARALHHAGFTEIHLSERTGSTRAAHVAATLGRTEPDFAAFLCEAGFASVDARRLTKAVARGGVLLTMRADARIDDALAVLAGDAVVATRAIVPVQREDLVVEHAAPPRAAPHVTPVDEQKRAAGYAAVDRFVRDGMRIGLGTGSTAYYAIERVGALVAAGASIAAVPTSLGTQALCERFGVPTTGIARGARLAVAIDGADEIDPRFDVIKGGGGALFREKVVALLADRFVVVADASKLVPTLGAFPLPLEVVAFAVPYVMDAVASLGVAVVERTRDGAPFRTDNGNPILDCAFATIPDPAALAAALSAIHGVVSVGLFVGLATDVLIADPAGVRALTKSL